MAKHPYLFGRFVDQVRVECDANRKKDHAFPSERRRRSTVEVVLVKQPLQWNPT